MHDCLLENLNILLVLLEKLERVFEKSINFSSNCQLRKEYPSLEKISSFDFARIHFFSHTHSSIQSKMQTKKCERKQKRFFFVFWFGILLFSPHFSSSVTTLCQSLYCNSYVSATAAFYCFILLKVYLFTSSVQKSHILIGKYWSVKKVLEVHKDYYKDSTTSIYSFFTFSGPRGKES
jgi:hypothetical protein